MDGASGISSVRSIPACATRGEYQVVVGRAGKGVIRHRDSGETMHSIHDPALEAYGLYVQQANLLELAQVAGQPLVIWDVGLGAATNAFEGIRALEGLSEIRREVRIVSFECDLDPLRLVAEHAELFEVASHPGVASLLREGKWRGANDRISWELLEGDFFERMLEAPVPDIIWFDPFSYKVNTSLWSVSVFERMREIVGARATWLYTYSASTAVRASMLVGGWYVAYGAATGQKRETSVAISEAGLASLGQLKLLGAEWLRRWERSDAARPFGYTGDDYRQAVSGHRQFRED
jgi:queuine tRNA-ribosyltransferase